MANFQLSRRPLRSEFRSTIILRSENDDNDARIHERTVARIAILNVRTTAAVIEDTLSMIGAFVTEKASAAQGKFA